MQRESVRGSQFQDRIVSRLPSDPTGVLVALDGDEDVYPSVFRLDVVTGQLTEVVRQRKPIMRWIADRDGVVRFGYGFGARRTVLARDSADSEWRTLLKFDRFDPDRLACQVRGAARTDAGLQRPQRPRGPSSRWTSPIAATSNWSFRTQRSTSTAPASGRAPIADRLRLRDRSTAIADDRSGRLRTADF